MTEEGRVAEDDRGLLVTLVDDNDGDEETEPEDMDLVLWDTPDCPELSWPAVALALAGKCTPRFESFSMSSSLSRPPSAELVTRPVVGWG